MNVKFVSLISCLLFIISCCLNFVTQVESNEFCTIKTKSGSIRGKKNHTLFDELPYYSFRGIPLAKPPIGHLRFKAPQKIDPWNGTLDAFEFGKDCVQPNRTSMEFFGFEDCLYLNVFVPNKCSALNPNTKMAVVYFIFGGENTHGTSRFYGPDFLLETNVILVTANNRLGVLGFMSMDDDDYSGNMALKDQVTGLRWVVENIEQFGGDANNITLFGHSVGSSAVNLLMISPKSKHLFIIPLLMSGSALNPMLPRRQNHYSLLSRLAESVHYPVSGKKDLLRFLLQTDAIQLVQWLYQKDYIPGFDRKAFNRFWTPRIEGPNATDSFLTQAPFDIITDENYNNNFDTLYSNSQIEVALSSEFKDPTLLEPFDEMFQIQLPLEMADKNYDSENYKNISTQIREFYFNGGHVNGETLDNMNTLMTDCKFIYPSILNARIQVAKSTGKTYYAMFSADNDFNYSQRKAKASNFTQIFPTHSDQLFYTFRFSGYPNLVSDQDYQQLKKGSLQYHIIKNITNVYMNFAKFGNPVPDEEPFYFKTSESKHFRFLNVTNKGVLKENDPHGDRMEFWNNISDEFKNLWNTTFDFHLA